MSQKQIDNDLKQEEIVEETQTIENEDANQSQEEVSLEVQLQTSLDKEKDKFLRLFAEFENYKKRTNKERIDLIKTANQEVLVAMLPVLDDFDRALTAINQSDDQNLVTGVNLIFEKLRNALASKGLETVPLAQGDDFNADFAEAITQIPAPSDALKGKIVDVVEKGYKLGDKIIRFPKVVLGQ